MVRERAIETALVVRAGDDHGGQRVAEARSRIEADERRRLRRDERLLRGGREPLAPQGPEELVYEPNAGLLSRHGTNRDISRVRRGACE